MPAVVVPEKPASSVTVSSAGSIGSAIGKKTYKKISQLQTVIIVILLIAIGILVFFLAFRKPAPVLEIVENDASKTLSIYDYDEFQTRRFSTGFIPNIVRILDDGRLIRMVDRKYVLSPVSPAFSTTVVPGDQVLLDFGLQSVQSSGINPNNIDLSPSLEYVAYSYSINRTYRCMKYGKLVDGDVQGLVNLTDTCEIQAFKWISRPRGRSLGDSGPLFVYTYKNDIYVNGQKMTNSSGEFHYFGVPDWVYSEEATTEMTFVSPNGKWLAYVEVDSTAVNKYLVPQYNNGQDNPKYNNIPYPYVGQTNPTVRFYYVNLENPDQLGRIQVEPPASLANAQPIFYNAILTDKKLLITWSDRNQTKVVIQEIYLDDSAMPKSPDVTVDFVNVNGLSKWAFPIDIHDCYTDDYATVRVPVPAGNNVFDSYAALSNGTYTTNYEKTQYFDEQNAIYCNNDFWFILGFGADGVSQNLYARFRNGTLLPLAGNEADDSCGYVLDFTVPKSGSNADYFFVRCEDRPFGSEIMSMRSLSNFSVLESSVKRSGYEGVQTPNMELFTMRLSSGIDANVMLLLPPNATAISPVPVYYNVYGGPDSNMIYNSTPQEFAYYLATIRGYAVFYSSVSGSGRRGWKITTQIRMNFGKAEIEDSVEVLRLVLARYDQLDRSRTLVFGASYGGFATAHMAAFDGGATIKCASIFAMVSNFRIYDSIYTERYLQLNNTAYNQAEIVTDANMKNLARVKLQVGHNLADDNVHFGNTAYFTEALIERNIFFDERVYTDYGHHNSRTEIALDHFMTETCFGRKLRA